MSRSAVSGELFVSFAYFDVVSFPSRPSSSRLRTRVWRSLRDTPRILSQNRALVRTVPRTASAEMALRIEKALGVS